MFSARATSLVVGSLFLFLANALYGADALSPHRDLYGDPLPSGAVMRLGTIQLRHPRHRGIAVAFSSDGKQLISCGGYEVRVWDTATGRLVRRTRLASKASDGDWHAYTYLTPDGSSAAVRDWGGLTRCFYDTATGQERGRLSNSSLMAFSPDSKKMAVSWWDKEGLGQVQLWDIAEFKKSLTLDVSPGTIPSAVKFTPDGEHLAALGKGRDKLLVWDAVTGKLRQRKKLPVPMQSLAYAPDGTTLALVRSGMSEAVIYDAGSLREKAVLSGIGNSKEAGRITSLVFSPDGRLLAGSCAEKEVPFGYEGYGLLVWDLRDPAKPRRLLSRGHFSGFDSSVFAFSPDSKTLAYRDSTSDVIDLWDVAWGWRLHQRPGHDTPVHKLAVSPDGKLLASGDYEPTLHLWDTTKGNLLRSLAGRDKVASPWFFSADGQRMISASSTGTFSVWEVPTGKELRQIRIDLPEKIDFIKNIAVESVALSSDGKRLAVVGSASNVVSASPDVFPFLFIWDTATGKQLTRRPLATRAWNHGTASQRMAYRWQAKLTPDGQSILEWQGDRLTLEDISTRSLLAILPQDVGDPQVFSADGRLLAAVRLQPKKEQPGRYDVKGLAIIETASGQEIVRLEIDKFDSVVFTSDGRAVVVTDKQKLSIWDTDTGERLHQMAWPEGVRDWRGELILSSLAALPGGRVATGTTEGDILIWDLAPATWPVRRPLHELSRDRFDALWSDLARDARTAYRAASFMEASPSLSVPLLGARIHPVVLDRKRVETLLIELDDARFEVREAASRELPRLLCAVEPRLRQALADKPSLETRRRLETILTEPRHPAAEVLRMRRAIAVLERIGTLEARRILEKLALGTPAPETREAQAALQRLKQRAASAGKGKVP